VKSADYIAAWLRAFNDEDKNALIWELAVEARIIADSLLAFDEG
jgi:hypothetical protein